MGLSMVEHGAPHGYHSQGARPDVQHDRIPDAERRLARFLAARDDGGSFASVALRKRTRSLCLQSSSSLSRPPAEVPPAQPVVTPVPRREYRTPVRDAMVGLAQASRVAASV